MKKQKPLYQTHISPSVKNEWMRKEASSWEDHNKPKSGHIYSLLASMPKGEIVCYTKEEINLVYSSANYQTTWDSDDKLVQRLEKKAGEICKEINYL